MARIEDQRILVWCNNEEHLKITLLDAIYLGLKLEKELCLFANYQTEKDKNLLQQRINNYAAIVKKDIASLSVSVLLLEGKLADLMPELGAKYNSVLFFCGDKMSNYLLKAFYQSVFPFFFSKRKENGQPFFKKVIIPIDFRSITKDATLWGSYFGRFVDSEIVLLQALETNKEQKGKVDKIVAFVKKFYGQFLFNYWFDQGKQNSWGIHREALQESINYDLLVFTGSLNVSMVDQLFGSFEKRVINADSTTPVLLINSQKEMCILCD